MQYVFGIQWAILPVTAGTDQASSTCSCAAMVLGSVSMACASFKSRSEISSNIAEDYVRTAHLRHVERSGHAAVLRNSLIPVVTYLGQDIGALMGVP